MKVKKTINYLRRERPLLLEIAKLVVTGASRSNLQIMNQGRVEREAILHLKFKVNPFS